MQEASGPIRFGKITVTLGKFTIYEGTGAKFSLSKKEIDLFPLIDNDVARAAQISSVWCPMILAQGSICVVTRKMKSLFGWTGWSYSSHIIYKISMVRSPSLILGLYVAQIY